MNVNKNIVLVLLMTISLCGCSLQYGIVQSEFNLSPESRLPKWVTIPREYSRKDLSMTITFYTHPFLSKVKMDVYGPAPDYKLLNETIGEQRYHPFTKNQPGYIYPRYIIISVKDIDEVFEHKTRGPVLYITDDPEIINSLKEK